MEVVVRFPKDMIRDERGRRRSRTKSPTRSRSSSGWKPWPGFRTRSNARSGPEGSDLVGPPMAAATFAPSVPDGRDVFGRRPPHHDQCSARSQPQESHQERLPRHRCDRRRRTVAREPARRRVPQSRLRPVRRERAADRRAGARRPAVAANRARGNWWPIIRANRSRATRSAFGIRAAPRSTTGRSQERPTDRRASTPQKIFADSWKMFLANARLKLQYASYDLAKLDEAQRDKLFAALKKFDSVVLAGPFTDAQDQEIKDAGIRVDRCPRRQRRQTRLRRQSRSAQRRHRVGRLHRRRADRLQGPAGAARKPDGEHRSGRSSRSRR